MFELAGDQKQISKNLADTVFRMETELAKISRSRTELRDQEKNYNKMSVKDFDQKYPALALATLLNQIPVTGSDYIVVGQPEFFDRLQELLRKRRLRI